MILHLRAPVALDDLGTNAVLLDAAPSGASYSDERQRLAWAVAEEMELVPWVQECITGMNNLLVIFDANSSSHVSVKAKLNELWASKEPKSIVGRQHVVNVRYGGPDGPDLSSLAEQCRLTPEQIVGLHSSTVYTVAALGGMPGFPFLSGLDERLHCPRRSVPRLSVPKGSVQIGGPQASVTPIAAPGGWHIIGATDFSVFDAMAEPPNVFRPGDTVRFVVESLSL